MPEPSPTPYSSFTEPRYDPEEVRAWFKDTAEPCPEILAPLHLLLPILKRRIGPVGKSGQMKAQTDKQTGEKKGPEYPFRKIEDILNEGHGPLCDLGVSWRKVAILRHELKANGKAETCVMDVEYELVGPLGDTVRTVATGEATDFGSDKATNKADTCARKNMLVDLLQLATEDPDSERPDRVDESPHVQRVSGSQWAEVQAAIKALPEETRAEVKEWADDKGMTVTGAGLTVGDYRKLKPYLAAVKRRLEQGGPDTVKAAMEKLEESVAAAKDARSRHPQPAAGAPAAPRGEAAADTAGDIDKPPVELVTAEHVATLKTETAKLNNDQRAGLLSWAEAQGINVEVAALPELTVDQFTALMRAIRNTLRSGEMGTAKKAASRPAKKAAGRATGSTSKSASRRPRSTPEPDPAPAPPAEDEAAAAERNRLRAELIGRAELLPPAIQAQFLTDLAAAKGPSGVPLADAIEACPPPWDRWLSTVIERLEAIVEEAERAEVEALADEADAAEEAEQAATT
jgi:hypothetical protein